VIVEYGRTPFGVFLGSLKNYTAIDLAIEATKGVLAKSTINPT